MGFENFKSNSNSEDSVDQADTLAALKALERIKKMKGRELSEGMSGLKAVLENKAWNQDLNEKEERKEMNGALDMLEGVKKGKAAEKAKETEEEEKARVCQNCGAEGLISDNFCGQCGNKFEKEKNKKENEEDEKTKICQKCGAEGFVSDDFCSQCGNKFEKFGNESEADKVEDRKDEILNAAEHLKEDDSPKDFETFEKKKKEESLEKTQNETESEMGENSELEKNISLITDRTELVGFLDSVEGIQGSKEFFKSADLKKIILDVLSSGNKEQLVRVTRTGGLRDKVNEIMIREKIEKM